MMTTTITATEIRCPICLNMPECNQETRDGNLQYCCPNGHVWEAITAGETRPTCRHCGSDRMQPCVGPGEFNNWICNACNKYNTIKSDEPTAAPELPADPINPPHYRQGKIECIAALKAALTPEEFRGHLKACVMKYLWRERLKGDRLENVGKAKWYLDLLYAELKNQ